MMLPEGRTAAAPSSRRCAAFVSAVAVIGWRHDLVTLLRTATLPVKPLSGSNGRSPAAALAKPQFYRRYCLIPGVREEGKKWAQSIAVLRPFAYVREWRSPNTPRYPGNARASGREVLLLPGAFLCPGPAAPHPAQTKKRPRRSRAGGRINAPVHVRRPTRPNWGGGRSLLDITLSGMTRCHPRVVPSPGPPCASRPGGSGRLQLD
jgi:hypothetical protein